MNSRLLLGLALLALLSLVAALAGVLAPYEKGHVEAFRLETVEGKEIRRYPPEPPSPAHLLGSDAYGNDLLTDMLHGLRWTLGTVFGTALLRAGLGLGLGMLVGSSRGGLRARQGFTPFAAIPGFVLAAFLLFPITINPSLPPLALFLAQMGILVLIELPASVAGFAARTAWLMEQPFVTAARSSGAGRAWLIRHHLLPFTFPDFLEALPTQALATASLVGKLGLVLVFIGGTTMTMDPRILRSTNGEWIGLLGYYRNAVQGWPWLFIAPFIGWLLVFACASLLSAGLRRSFAASRRFGGTDEEGPGAL